MSGTHALGGSQKYIAIFILRSGFSVFFVPFTLNIKPLVWDDLVLKNCLNGGAFFMELFLEIHISRENLETETLAIHVIVSFWGGFFSLYSF